MAGTDQPNVGHRSNIHNLEAGRGVIERLKKNEKEWKRDKQTE